MNRDDLIWVLGHKNPDTDAICSAIAYANFKNMTDKGTYVPKKAGEMNEETRYVLKTFQCEEPETVFDVSAQIKDLALKYTPGVKGSYSLRRAWEQMRELNVVTLPIVNDKGQVEGIITSDDIARSYMNVYDNETMSSSRTSYANVVETLDGKLWTGNDHGVFHRGKVVIGSGDRDNMRREIAANDMVITGNAWERQVIAINENPSCLIICGVNSVEDSIIAMAREKEIVIISTTYDIFTTARLIHQAMPIRQFMTTSKNLIWFGMDDYLEDVTDRLNKIRHRDFPIVDEQMHYVAMFSRRILLSKQKKKVILVDHNEKNQAVDGIEDADILEIIDHHRLGSLETISPIVFRNQPLGCSCSIIYQMYQEKKIEIPRKIAGLMCSAILSDTLMFRSPTCTPYDEAAARTLAEIADIDIEEHAMAMFEAGSNFRNKSTEEIMFTDFKTFTAGDVNFGVSQVSSVSAKQLAAIKEKLLKYMETVIVEKNLHMIFVMLTNILEQSTELLYAGTDSRDIVLDAYGEDRMAENSAILPGVVSRKKQVVPQMIEAIHYRSI